MEVYDVPAMVGPRLSQPAGYTNFPETRLVYVRKEEHGDAAYSGRGILPLPGFISRASTADLAVNLDPVHIHSDGGGWSFSGCVVIEEA